jgi:hypothetical protein
MIENKTEAGESIVSNTLIEGKWPITKQYPDLKIPEDWDTLEEFVEWYMGAGKPICIPWDSIVIRTDDATAMPIFKHKRYMVEFYMIHPFKVIPTHCHPDMEVITVTLGGGRISGPESLFGTGERCGIASKKLLPGEYHGGKPTQGSWGFGILSFEKWLNDAPMISAAVQWKGDTAGPVHDNLIKKIYPDALIEPGKVDITRVFR